MTPKTDIFNVKDFFNNLKLNDAIHSIGSDSDDDDDSDTEYNNKNYYTDDEMSETEFKKKANKIKLQLIQMDNIDEEKENDVNKPINIVLTPATNKSSTKALNSHMKSMSLRIIHTDILLNDLDNEYMPNITEDASDNDDESKKKQTIIVIIGQKGNHHNINHISALMILIHQHIQNQLIKEYHHNYYCHINNKNDHQIKNLIN